MGFIMDGLEAEAYDRTYSDRQLVARIIGYFRPRMRDMLLVAVTVVIASLTGTARDPAGRAGDRPVGATACTIEKVAPLVVLAAAQRAGRVGRRTSSGSGAARWRSVMSCWRCARMCFGAVVKRDMSFYDEFPRARSSAG